MCYCPAVDAIVTYHESRELVLYSPHDGRELRRVAVVKPDDEEVRVFGLGFISVGGVCATHRGTVLAVDPRNNIIDEVDLRDSDAAQRHSGPLVRSIGRRVLSFPLRVSCNADVVVVSEYGAEPAAQTGHRVSILSFATGRLRARIVGVVARGLRLSSDGRFVIATHYTSHSLDAYTLQGTRVATVSLAQPRQPSTPASSESDLPPVMPYDVEEVAPGTFVVAGNNYPVLLMVTLPLPPPPPLPIVRWPCAPRCYRQQIGTTSESSIPVVPPVAAGVVVPDPLPIPCVVSTPESATPPSTTTVATVTATTPVAATACTRAVCESVTDVPVSVGAVIAVHVPAATSTAAADLGPLRPTPGYRAVAALPNGGLVLCGDTMVVYRGLRLRMTWLAVVAVACRRARAGVCCTEVGSATSCRRVES